MNEFKALNFETRFIAFFAISSLLIVVLTGAITGIGIKLILFRALIAVIIFSGLAYAIIIVLKNFVPEVYNILSRTSSNRTMDETLDGEEKTEEVSETGEMNEEPIAGSAGEKQGYSEVADEDGMPTDATNDGVVQPELDKKDKKLGKHLVKFESLDKYEPKIMAEAVRTMMRKDEE